MGKALHPVVIFSQHLPRAHTWWVKVTGLNLPESLPKAPLGPPQDFIPELTSQIPNSASLSQ